VENMFITKIRVNKIRHIENLDIDLSWSKKMNLIITGKNGSGKTSLLETIRDTLFFDSDFDVAAELVGKLIK